MRLGISSFTYNWAIRYAGAGGPPFGVAELLSRAVALGVEVVQFGDNLPLHHLRPEEIAALRRDADEQGLQVEVGMRGLTPEAVSLHIALARELGSPLLRVVTDTPEYEPAPEQVVEVLRAAVPELEAAGVVLAVENHDRFRARQLRAMIEAVGSRQVGVCLDTVNSLVALEDPCTVIMALADLTVNLHLKDVRACRDETGLGVVIQGTPAGQGQVDLRFVVATIGAVTRGCSAILEQWTPPLADPAATVAREARWAEESIAYLKTLL